MISVIVPFYNAEEVIERCIHSFSNQTNRNFELLLVDDGSTDNSRKLLEKYIYSDTSNISSYYQENQGVAVARNTGLSKAKGENIIFVDVDDYIENCFIEKFDQTIDVKIDFTCCSYVIEYPKRNKKIEKKIDKLMSNLDVFTFILNMDKLGMLNVVWNKMFSRSIIIENNIRFNSELRSGEDIDFVYQYCKFIKGFRIIEEIIYHYIREEHESILTGYIEGLEKNVEYVNMHRDVFYKDSPLRESDYEMFLKRTYMSEQMSVLHNMYKDSANKNDKVRVLTKIINDKKLQGIVRDIEPRFLSEKLFFTAIKSERYFLLSSIYSILFFLRKRFDYLYGKSRTYIFGK